jgi:hypothetical protein
LPAAGWHRAGAFGPRGGPVVDKWVSLPLIVFLEPIGSLNRGLLMKPSGFHRETPYHRL